MDDVQIISPTRLTCRDWVLAHVGFCRNGATDEEIIRCVGYSPNTVRPRRVELTHQGLLYDSGQRRKTASGKPAIVWKAVVKKAIGKTG